ncbi:hypothetical protein TNCV_270831 [Trichonephila clavipes]|nr:hypothetical protein TNCV_270831 [Trichonephila clavipes]
MEDIKKDALRTSHKSKGGFLRNSSLPCNKSTDGKKRTSELSGEAELILEANRLQLMKQDLEKAENAYFDSLLRRSRRRYTWC